MLATRSRTFPLPSQQSIAVDFIENRHVDLERTGVERTCTFDAERQKFVPSSTVQQISFDEVTEQINPLELQRTQDDLKSAIEKLKEQKGKKCDRIAKFHLADAHSWSDVVRIVTEAEETYLKDDTASGKVRRAFRRLGDNAKSIKPFIGLLPEGNYKTLCGGLTLVLTAMMKKAEMREKMADILNELPLTIQECEDYAQLYPGKNSLRKRIEELYIQLVGAIEDMVRWYTAKSFSRTAKSVFKNDAYSDVIDRRIKEIQCAKLAFDREADKYLHWRTDMIDRTTQETNENVKLIGRKVWETSNQLQNAQTAIKQNTEVVNGVYDVLCDLRLNSKWLEEKKTYQQEIKDQDQKLRDREEHIKLLEMRLQKKTLGSKMFARRLDIKLPSDGFLDDMDHALTAGATSTLRFQTRSKQIAEAKEFRRWFTTNHSSMLCVNGSTTQDALSPTAYLVALLVQSLQSEKVLVLPFFCGLHTDSSHLNDHEIGGPLLLLRALLAQVLSIKDIDEKQYLSFLVEDDIQAMEDAAFSRYLEIFIELLGCLMEDYNGIVIMLDGIEYYDISWRREVKKLFKRLAKATNGDTSIQGSLKVLLMASSHSSLFRKIRGNDILEMPDELDGEGSGFESLGEL